MILLISTCKEKFHDLEFVKPIEDILKNNHTKFFTKPYLSISKKDLSMADKVIICGTSLADFDYLNHLDEFNWLKDYSKAVLGICAGMQVIGRIFGGKIKNKAEIGFFKENFEKSFLGLSGEQEVYHLHNSSINFSKVKEFEIYSGNKQGVIQAVKHLKYPIYGVLFHPEVRNKNLILEFVKDGN